MRHFITSLLCVLCAAVPQLRGADTPTTKRPNILIAISDDHSFPHTSAAGFKAVRTPAFDRVAREGILFRNAFASSPGCSPSRASLLTGRHTWQIEQARTHASSFPTNYVVFPDLLEAAGYAVGYTGKGWGPGNWKVSGRPRNPAGPEFSRQKLTPPFKGIANNDYAGNFQDFLAQRPKGRPFYFWYGAHEPHRVYEKGAGLKAGKKLEEVVVPPFLPDTPDVRSDLLDYHDIDGCPTLTLLTTGHNDPVLGRFLQLAVAKRPPEELFDIVKDPGCLTNLAGEAAFAKTKADLSNQLTHYLKQTGDSRVVGDGDIWESYPRYSPIRKFPPPETRP